jgi:tetratricopeptide (TPR) repeat protein
MYAPGYGGANANALVNNAMLTVPASVVTWIPSVKADYSINPKAKISGFWSRNSYGPSGSAGLPAQISPYMPTPSVNNTVRINFDYAEGHLNLGAGYYQTGRYPEAIESYKQAIRIKPGLAEAHLDLGMTYLRLGDYKKALELINECLQLQPDNEYFQDKKETINLLDKKI